MPEPELLELSEEGFWRRAAVQPATRTALTRHALAVPEKLTPIFKGKAAIVPRPEVRWLVEPEERPLMPVTEGMTLEWRQIAEPEHEVARPEPEHDAALAELTEVPRPGVWKAFELERETAVAKVLEAPQYERSRLLKKAAAAKLEAIVSQVQLRGGVP